MQRVLDGLVDFEIRDSYHPAPQWLLDHLHGRDVLQGRIVDRIRGWDVPGRQWNRGGEYLALEVQGIPQIVLVPAHRVKRSVGAHPVRQP